MAKKYNHVEQEINTETGEVKTIRKSFTTRVKGGQDFYMTFIEHMAVLFKINSALDRKVLEHLCMLAEYNTGKVYLDPSSRKQIQENMGVKSQAISRSLNNLKQLKLITGERTVYTLNPNIFWKGTTDARDKVIREFTFKIDFSIDAPPDST